MGEGGRRWRAGGAVVKGRKRAREAGCGAGLEIGEGGRSWRGGGGMGDILRNGLGGVYEICLFPDTPIKC